MDRTRPAQGVRLHRLTGPAGIHCNLYCEVPYTDPTGRYVFYTQYEAPRTDSFQVLRYDLAGGAPEPLFDRPVRFPGVLAGAAMSADNRYFFCTPLTGPDTFEILRIDTTTLAREAFRFRGAPLVRTLGSVGPDPDVYVGGVCLGSTRRCNAAVRFDLARGRWRVLVHDELMYNPHPQIEPGRGRRLMLQHNGFRFLFTVDLDGCGFTSLCVGPAEPTGPPQGHQCWIGATGRVLATTSAGTLPRMERPGMLWTCVPGRAQACALAGGFNFAHPNVSRDGRFFVADGSHFVPEDVRYPGGAIVVGSVRTGLYRMLCAREPASCRDRDMQAFAHAHPYFTPDCAHVIYNVPAGPRTVNVYAATVPDGLLAALDRDER